MKMRIVCLVLLCATTFLGACSGGGGEGAPPAENPPAEGGLPAAE